MCVCVIIIAHQARALTIMAHETESETQVRKAKRRIAELLWLLPVALGTGRNSIKTGGRAVGFSLTSHFSTGL